MKETLTILFRRKWHALGFFALMIGLPLGLAYVLPPKYEGKATLLLTSGREKKPFVPTDRDSSTPFMQVSMEDVGSEVEILLSRPVLTAVVDRTHLDRPCTTDGPWTMKTLACAAGTSLHSFLVGVGLKSAVPPREDAIDRLHDKVNVEFLKRTNIIEVTWRGSSPELARDVVNALVDAYLEHHILVHGNAYAIDTIRQQADEGAASLMQAENRLSEYSSKNSVSNVDKQRGELLEKLSEAESKVGILEGLGRSQAPTAELGSLSGDPAFLELSKKLTDAELRRIDLSFKFNADSWQVVAVNKEIDQLRTLLRERLAGNLEKWKALADSYRRELAALDEKKIDIDRMKREVDELTERDRLNRDKLHEMMMSKSLDLADVASVKVVERAEASTDPAFPRRMLILIVSIILGLVGAPTWAFAVDRLSGKVVSVADIESTLDLHVLASIPEYAGRNGAPPDDLDDRLRRDLIPVEKTLGLDRPGGPAVYLVTSPSQGAGTSQIASALAGIAAAGAPGKALLISIEPPALAGGAGNGHVPGQAIAASMTADPGSRALAGQAFESMVLAVGSSGGGKAGDENVESLVETARTKYKHVVLDVQGQQGDALYLKFLPRVDAVILVAAYDRTGKHPLARMTEVIQRQGGRIAGCVFNRRRDPIPQFLYRRLFW
jgi:uncharacterized protein involved in exopolysaccharide biosynthesis